MDRFYVDHPFKEHAFLDDIEEIKHITKVLRFSVGDYVEIFDSVQGEYIAKISAIDSKRIYFDIQKRLLSYHLLALYKTHPCLKDTLFYQA